MGNPKAGGGGSMFLIILAIFVVAGVFIYVMNPVLFEQIVQTVKGWLHLR